MSPRETPSTFEDLLDAATPALLRHLSEEIDDRLARTPTPLNEYGYDPWGFHRDAARKLFVAGALLYRYWFRVENVGIEHLPAGRCMVIGNHAGQIAIDGMMTVLAALLEGEPPRILRGMGEYFLPSTPFLSIVMHRMGSVVGTPKNCVDLLERDEAVAAFPEGVRGISKLFWERYRLKRFGQGFMRLALEADAPIVPVAIIGSEEQAIAIANLDALGRRIGLPSFPITLTWPWLGPLGLLPLPVKYRIHWGEPMHFRGSSSEDDDAIEDKVEAVRARIQTMLDAALAERSSWFE